MKTKKIIALLFFGLAFLGLKAQTMYVRPSPGAQTAYGVANIKRLTFSGGNLVVTTATGNSGSHLLASNRYLNFTDLTLETTTQELATHRFYVYPNPVTSVLHITNQDQFHQISGLAIISLQGRLLLEQNGLNANTTEVDLATLPQGMYFCKITSNNQFHTIKFLKQ